MLTNEIDLFASEFCANWLKFECFAWDYYNEDDSLLWGIWYYSNRDSSLLEQANGDYIENHWYKEHEFNKSDNIRLERHNHWAVGYVDGLSIKVYKDDTKVEYTDEFELFYNEIIHPLQDYPVLNDEIYSQLEYDTLTENIRQCLQFDCKFDLIDNLPDEYLENIQNMLWDKYNEDCENLDNHWLMPEHLQDICTQLGYIENKD